MKVKLWQDWLLIAAAAWLLVSPFVLGFASFDHPAAWFAIVLGILLLISATEALVLPDVMEEWVDLLIGGTLIASPWLVGFRSDGTAAINCILVGFLVTIVSLGTLGQDLRVAEKQRHAAHH